MHFKDLCICWGHEDEENKKWKILLVEGKAKTAKEKR